MREFKAAISKVEHFNALIYITYTTPLLGRFVMKLWSYNICSENE